MSKSPDTFDDKHPLADRPATIDWTNDLGQADTIADSQWTFEGPDEALELYNPSISGKKTTIWMKGGTNGAQYRLTNVIKTPAPVKTLPSVKLVNIRDSAK
jgi:hypothetical protein